jgi:hypothetical protein
MTERGRVAGPPIGEAKALTRRCLVGGIDHIAGRECGPEETARQEREAVKAVGSRGLILAAGRAVSPG